MLDGAAFQAKDRGSEIVAIPETCDAEDGCRSLTKALLASGAEAAIGFLCTESLEATLPALAEAGMPALTLSVRSDILMEDALKKKWPFFRLVPSAKVESGDGCRDHPVALEERASGADRRRHDPWARTGGKRARRAGRDRPDAGLLRHLSPRPGAAGQPRPTACQERCDACLHRRRPRRYRHHRARRRSPNRSTLTLMGGETLERREPAGSAGDGVLAVSVPDYATLPEAKPVSDAMTGGTAHCRKAMCCPPLQPCRCLEQAKDQAGKDESPLVDAAGQGRLTRPPIGTIRFNASHELRRQSLSPAAMAEAAASCRHRRSAGTE